MQKYIVLKPTGPMKLCNNSMKIKQGVAIKHPGYELAEGVFDVFDDKDKANAAATKNAEKFNNITRHGITTKQSIGKKKAEEATDRPSEEERKQVIEDAKILTKDGLIDPKVEKLQEKNAKLEAEIKELKSKEGNTFSTADAESLLDQNVRTTRKVINKQKLSPNEAKIALSVEKKGKKRGMIMSLLSKLSDKSIKKSVGR